MFDQNEMLSTLGSEITNKPVERFKKLAIIPQNILDSTASIALSETWGDNNYALRKYLSVQIPWSIQQGKFSINNNQLIVTAGNIQTRYGTPIYLAFEENTNQGNSKLYCKYSGYNISAPDLPNPPSIPDFPEIHIYQEIIMMHDHMIRDNYDRVEFLQNTPEVAQMCALSGAIQWSLNRGLQLPYWYFGRMGYLVPLYLNSREDISQAPDLIAPIQVGDGRILVRTILLPYMAYANARISVPRHDKLPPWMIAAWKEHATNMTVEQIDSPE